MNSTLTPAMDETFRFIYTEIIERYTPEYVKTIEFTYTPWVFSILGSIVIGLSGIFPLLVIPDDTSNSAYTNREYLFCRFVIFLICCYYHKDLALKSHALSINV